MMALLSLPATVLLNSPARADVTVALTPSPALVAPGATFELDITVTEAGSTFNGFDAYLQFDPLALTFLGFSPISLQQGSLITSACSNTFHRFKVSHDSLTITDVLLCNGVDVTGPGQLYRLQFRASSLEQITHVVFLPGLQFYEAGTYVNPSHSTDAQVQIGNPVAVGPGPAPFARLGLRASRNPFHHRTEFLVDSSGGEGESLIVYDISGKPVRHLESGVSTVGKHTVTWDGRTDSGGQAPAGVYVARLTAEGRVATTRVALLR